MNKNKYRRRSDIKISMVPEWMDIAMVVCKWFICVMPFIICSFLFFFKAEMSIWDNMLLTVVYLLSLSSLINCVND
jgi:hypothetical protein